MFSSPSLVSDCKNRESGCAVPSGLVTKWCIQDSIDVEGNANVCGDSGKNHSDYGTICCAGDIVDRYGYSNDTINLDTLVCCRIKGP